MKHCRSQGHQSGCRAHSEFSLDLRLLKDNTLGRSRVPFWDPERNTVSPPPSLSHTHPLVATSKRLSQLCKTGTALSWPRTGNEHWRGYQCGSVSSESRTVRPQAAAVINVLFLRAHKKDFFRQAGHRKIVERELNRRSSLIEMDFYTHTPGKSK